MRVSGARPSSRADVDVAAPSGRTDASGAAAPSGRADVSGAAASSGRVDVSGAAPSGCADPVPSFDLGAPHKATDEPSVAFIVPKNAGRYQFPNELDALWADFVELARSM